MILWQNYVPSNNKHYEGLHDANLKQKDDRVFKAYCRHKIWLNRNEK